MTTAEGTAAREIAQGWQRVHPLAMVVGVAHGLRQAVIPAAAALFGARSLDNTALVAAGIVLAALAISTLAAWLGWRRLRYLVGPDDIRVEKGVLSRSARSVPYERIQDVSLEQALLSRLLGLVEVKFETGAGGGEELKLAWVASDEGERLRDVVRERREESPAVMKPRSETAAAMPEPEGRLLFRMGPARLLLFGLFEFSLVVFAVLAGATQQLDFLLPFDLWDAELWQAWLGGPDSTLGSRLAELGWAARIAGAVAALGLLIVLGLATGVVRTALRDWDFRLELTPRGFRRRRGLVTRTDVVMPVHRVQAVELTTGMVRRLFGWHGLKFVSLAQDAKSADHDVVPFAQVAEIAHVVSVAGFALPDEATGWQRQSRAYRRDRILLSTVPLALAGTVLLLTGPAAAFGFVLFAVAGLTALRHRFLWRFERHGIDSRQVLARRGWLAPRVTVASRVKLHSVELVQGPLARRHGYASLRFGLAGGALAFDGLPLAEALAMRDGVLQSIVAVDFSALPR